MSKYVFLTFVAFAFFIAVGCRPKSVSATSAPPPEGEEVTFKGVGGLMLKGTLLRPAGGEKAPAMLLLPGSGPSDRDGNQAGLQINILKDIAEKLQSEGIATLRFDKRAVPSVYGAEFPKDPKQLADFFSWPNFVEDADAAYKFLQSRPGIDPHKVGVLGHSEGGAIALAMEKDVHPAALVLVSTAGRDLGEVIVTQIGPEGYSAQFTDAATIKKYDDIAKQAVDSIRSTGHLPVGLNLDKLAPLFPTYIDVYFHGIFNFDPAAAAARCRQPVLVVQGLKDIQVSPKYDAPRLMKALPKATSELYEVPNATHCMKKFTNAADPGLTGPMIPAVLDRIAGWTKAHLSGNS